MALTDYRRINDNALNGGFLKELVRLAALLKLM